VPSLPFGPRPAGRRCERCGRALTADERACEGCSLAEISAPAGRRRVVLGPLVFGVVAATIQMAIVLWFLFGRG
jgi:hypothetical protein